MFSLILGIFSVANFLFWYKNEPRQFRNVFFLAISIYFSIQGMMWLWRRVFPTLRPTEMENSTFELTSSGNVQGIVLVLFVMALISLSIFLMKNFFILIKKEGTNFSYGILPISAVSVYIWILLEFFIRDIFLKEVFMGLVMYVPLMTVSYLVYSKWYRLVTKEIEPEYIIIHGASLINDQPSPLLVNRLNKGVELFNKFQQKPKFIVSGGKGLDEVISESEAMKNYLIGKGIAEEQIIEEKESTNTYENLLYSKRIINYTDEKIAIISNEFHILRCVIYAKNMNFSVYGIGCNTVGYYRVFGELREVLAFLVKYKGVFLIYVLLIMLASYLHY